MDHRVDLSSIEGKELKRPGSSKVLSRIAQIRLVNQHPEVYEPCDDSFALVDALLADRVHLVDHQPLLCMEIGCGSGYVITSLAIMLGLETCGTQYFTTDINPHAVETTRRTLEAHGVHAEIVMTNIASGLVKRLSGMMDVVVVNPPYVPTPEEEVGLEGISASWAGGENGRRVIDKILPIVDELLSEKGWLYMVTLTANNPSEICRIMRDRGYGSRIIVQRSTEQESLHVIKFWREGGTGTEGRDGARAGDSGAGSWLWSLWKNNGGSS
ncbi:hemK methyltransferase family member 2 [Iris pallida]|uniref:HemK methyltransferase family member 2 n=1 Tax=Iris pallida TaxID=29817 RepID=A0AAX6E9T5_IRIPA|nr:hemK methyltransferase family member 2 [Iris pallida]